MSKVDRIRRLIPWFEKGRIFLPPMLVKANYEGREFDLIRSFVDEEYMPFPVAGHDDMLDSLSRFLEPDLPIEWPEAYEEIEDEPDPAAQGRNALTGY